MKVTLAQHDVVVAAYFYLVAVVGAKEHPVAYFSSSHVLP
jgi:hypothetical protein